MNTLPSDMIYYEFCHLIKGIFIIILKSAVDRKHPPGLWVAKQYCTEEIHNSPSQTTQSAV